MFIAVAVLLAALSHKSGAAVAAAGHGPAAGAA